MSPSDGLPESVTNVGSDRIAEILKAALAVGSDLDLPVVLRRIVESAVALVDAHYGALGMLDETRTSLSQFITIGISDEDIAKIGPFPKGHGILGLVIRDPRPVRLPDLTRHPDSYGFPPNHPPMHSFLGVPIHGRSSVLGNLYLTDKRTGDGFTEADESVVTAFAAAAAVAIENARLHARLRLMTLAEDRERIARDLHDTVIQRLFATGLSLQATDRMVSDADVNARIRTAIDDLDSTIREIRSAIFALGTTYRNERSVRSQVVQAIEDSSRLLAFAPRLEFHGPVDSVISDQVAEQLVPVLREALTNIAKHAKASAADVNLSVTNKEVILVIEDNGVGMPQSRTAGGRGIRSFQERAKAVDGTSFHEAREPSGTRLVWTAPID